MPDEVIPTTALLKKLFKTRHIGNFFTKYGDQMEGDQFHEYIKRLCEKNNVLPAHVIVKSGIERTYGHQLFNGTKKPSRDKVLQLAFGFGMDYHETQTLLKTARKREFHPKNKRDAVVIFALAHGYDIHDTQATLCELSLPLLGEDYGG